jgi:hypothetical protein
MILNLVALLLVLLLTFYHSLFGAFSGLINVVCCLTATVVAYGCTDVLNDFVTQQGLSPTYSLPLCLVALFAISHLILRLLADNFIRGNVRVPMYVDWVGGGACGFLIAMMTTGVLVTGFLMLPWGGRALMYSRIERTDRTDPQTGRVQFAQNRLWLRCDEFNAGLFGMLSGGSLGGKTAFASVYPSYPEWVFWSGNTVQHESATAPSRDENSDGFNAKGLQVQRWWEQHTPLTVAYRGRLPARSDLRRTAAFSEQRWEAEPGKRLIGMRLELAVGSADPAPGGTRFHRFRPTMIRLVGADKRTGEPQHYHARVIGGADPGEDHLRLADVDNNFAIPAVPPPAELDVYFEVDEDFEPHFVEYRRFARAPVKGEPGTALADRLMGPVVYDARARMIPGTLFTRAILPEGTGDSPELPFPIALSALTDAEVSQGRLLSGRIHGDRQAVTGSGPSAVQEIALRERSRVFQLRCQARTAASLAGRVFDFANLTLNQYAVVTDRDTEVSLAGYYAIVERGGQEYFELYLAGPDEVAYTGLLDFKHVTRQELRSGTAIVGFIFFVPPGQNIVRFQNQTKQGIQFDLPGYRVRP